jgi:hypothetical protein
MNQTPSMITLKAIREALRTQPFRPFVLKLADGQSFPIRHPQFIALLPVRHLRDIVVFTEETDSEPGAYRARRINIGSIAEVTSPSEPPGPPPNWETQPCLLAKNVAIKL